ncbi:cullin-4A [Trichonephila clavipes]|nr:cullin-4A [Trichonephila clavipes]
MIPSSGQSDAKPPVFSSQANLVVIYRPTEDLKGWVDLAHPGLEPRTCDVEARYTTTQSLDFALFKLLGLGSNPGEDMDVCKCIVPFRHWGTLNSRRAATSLVWLAKGEERWEAPGLPQDFLPLNWGGTEKNRTVTCMVFKAKANDMRKNSSP